MHGLEQIKPTCGEAFQNFPVYTLATAFQDYKLFQVLL